MRPNPAGLLEIIMPKHNEMSTDSSGSHQKMPGKKSGKKSLIDDLWDDDDDALGYQDQWMDTDSRETESSRNRRQAAARRELERRLESKRLRKRTMDWYDDDYFE
jgi:hypothetical protein